ncbi:MAG: hypothetical protein AAGA68_16920 [Pseudomonadota bacterium]
MGYSEEGYADSAFEFEDQNGGDGVEVTVDQETGEITETALVGIVPPANLFGLSNHVTSTQLFWSNDRWFVQAIYNTRSGYFQHFARDAFGRIRYTRANQRLDVCMRYNLTDNLRVSLEAKNILDEARFDDRAVEGNTFQTLSYGPRLFPGLRGKF